MFGGLALTLGIGCATSQLPGPGEDGAVDGPSADGGDLARPDGDGLPEGGPPDAAPEGSDARTCRTHSDCAGEPVARRCNPASGRCVECLPSEDTCPAHRHCEAATHACVDGCRNDDGCAAGDGGPPPGDGGVARVHCARAAHRCVECLEHGHCPSGHLCTAGACVPGCNAEFLCPRGLECCSGQCVDPQTSTSHCGGCGRPCRTEGGEPACERGRCAIAACAVPRADCNGEVPDGCEVNTATDPAHCGACDHACAAPGGVPGCRDGACTIASCRAPNADCNDRADDGCETDTATDPQHCGDCDTACAERPHAGATCVSGTCGVRCTGPWVDCNREAADGCERDTSSDPAHCGECGRSCPERPHAAPACVDSACALRCSAPWADCNATAGDGCETNVRTTVEHCGACAAACTIAHGTPACSDGACAVAGCDTGWADCNGGAGDGCEADTRTTVAHCGGCGRACPAPDHGTAGCAAGACTVAGCDGGWADCDRDAATGCEVNVGTNPAHCGDCGRACSLPHATAGCTLGACTVAACDTEFGDCNLAAGDGCEVDLRASGAHCGRCGAACPPSANATASCTAGACGFACNTGFGDCNGVAGDGCEIDVRANLAHCGRCGNACPAGAHAAAACAAGTCGLTCDAGYGDCTAGDGCETELRANPAHCGRCGNACPAAAHATPTCAAGACGLACETGFGDCNGTAGDGCETDLRAADAHCGACGRACAPGSRCTGGTCASIGPPHDTRAGAIEIPLATPATDLVTDTTSAANHTSGSCGCTGGNDVFYRFTLTRPEIVYADTFGGASWDTSLFLQDASGANITDPGMTGGLPCDDDGGMSCGSLQTQMYARLNPGTYYLVLSGCGAGPATIHFQHLPVGNGGVTGRLNPTSTAVQTLTGTTAGSGTVSASGSDCAGSGPENTYWFVTCPGYLARDLDAATCGGAGWDTFLVQRSALRAPLSICNDDACALQSRLEAALPAGPGLHAFYLDGFGGEAGAYTAWLLFGGCPAGQTVCAPGCRDLATDASHCGACGHACAPGASCSGGTCSATPPVTLNFPQAGDTRYSLYGDRFWNAGDHVQGARSTSLPRAGRAVVHIPISPNGLTCDTQDMRMLINGTAVGTFRVAAGASAVDATYAFAAITGPTYTLRYETTRTVRGGCGSAGIPNTGGTVTLSAP